MGEEIWGRQLTTRGAEIGVPRGGHLTDQNEPKSGVPSIVYLHASLDIRFAMPHAIHRESNEDPHALGSRRSSCHPVW